MVINDPEVVYELYVTKNKYTDKAEKFHRQMKRMFNDSILLSRSDDLWASKRKHLSAAFYKERVTKMLEMVIKCATTEVDDWKTKYIGGHKTFELQERISYLVTECVL